MAMKIAGYFKRILSTDKIVVRGAATLRTVLCGLFIVLIALFRTSPVGELGKGEQPVPLPPELGIEDFTLRLIGAEAPPPALTEAAPQ
ncbi:hypothetical protein CR105_09265 [Massilia eurypsychrophila]|uniref:Uncharacterized protein n=1 Tax=Massilia eurypsychrophila TaxID=1485217 RepID=A0A2G8TH21_9BURK|nr:hypothetical protein CR105_09265 [Massilia eurypsychrophila]